VRGANCVGKPFEETVAEILDAYTVKLDGLYIAPISLIRKTTPVFAEPA